MGTCASAPATMDASTAKALAVQRSISRLQGMALLEVDAYGRITFASEGCAEVGGVSASKLLDEELANTVHPTERSEIRGYFTSYHMAGNRIQLRYRRRVPGLTADDVTFMPLVFAGEWVNQQGVDSCMLIGFERRMLTVPVEKADGSAGPVVLSATAIPPDAAPDPVAVEAAQEAAAKAKAKELASRRAVRSAYHELTNSLHAVNTVALALRDSVTAMEADAAEARSTEWRVADPLQLQQDIADLVAAGKQADVVSKDIRVLDRTDDDVGAEEPFPLFSKLSSLAESMSLLAASGEGGIMLVMGEDVPILPVMEGSALLDAVQSAIAHAMKLSGSERVLVIAGVHPDKSSRLEVEVIHRADSIGNISMADIEADLTAAAELTDVDVMSSSSGGRLSGMTGTRAQRLRLMAAVVTEVARAVDASVDMMEREGVFRFCFSVPWRAPTSEAMAQTGVADLEAKARRAHGRNAVKHTAIAVAAIKAAEAGEDPDASAPRLLFLRGVPPGFVAPAALALIHRDAKEPSLLPEPDTESREAAEAAAAAAARPGAAAAASGRAGQSKGRQQREARRRARQTQRAEKSGAPTRKFGSALVGHPEWAGLRGRHVLVVDDVAMVRRSGSRMLELLGCTCELLEDGDEIAGALRNTRRQFDAILLDIVMTRSDGGTICTELREKHKFMRPIVAMTGHTAGTDVVRYFGMGFDVVLGKPFSVDQLASKLVEGIQRRGNAQRIRRVAARIDDDSDSKELHSRAAGDGDEDDAGAGAARRPPHLEHGGQQEGSDSGDHYGVTVSGVRTRIGGRAARPGARDSGTGTPVVRRTLDEPIGHRDKGLTGKADIEDLRGDDEPVLGLQRGMTVGMSDAVGAGGGSRRTAKPASRGSRAVRSQTAVLGGSSSSRRTPIGPGVVPPGRVDSR
ncbi:hypothetical protein FNF29_01672 [Cafeteria roenbergensis]|uniref:Response regulatory domain-containing protein n=1 Tax=Cafeteria roenbergensis TaxID=33653 RepID=A0A5A8CTF5_CAFRO|nr:hypothetical protein FNF29_01672 [Cafeteria roenbergensis]|eukprot:KAA0155757.1 hypothetical protein FNF29_01672 [Cafeteria roenbergensis]